VRRTWTISATCLLACAGCRSRDATPPKPTPRSEIAVSAEPELPRPGHASLALSGAFAAAVEGDGTSCGDQAFFIGSAELDGPKARPRWSLNVFAQRPGDWTAALSISPDDSEGDPKTYVWKGAAAAPHLVVSSSGAKVALTLAGIAGGQVKVVGDLRCPVFPTEAVPEAIRSLLSRHAGSAARPYSTVDFGRAHDPGAASAIVRGDATLVESKLRDLRQSLPPGWVAFLGTSQFLGDERWPSDSVELVVAPGSGPLDILRIARTDAVNYGLQTEALIRALAEWDRAWGIDVIHAETDTIELALTRMPPDLSSFAREVYALCPDVVDQGTGSIEALQQEIATRRRVFLWWD